MKIKITKSESQNQNRKTKKKTKKIIESNSHSFINAESIEELSALISASIASMEALLVKSFIEHNVETEEAMKIEISKIEREKLRNGFRRGERKLQSKRKEGK